MNVIIIHLHSVQVDVAFFGVMSSKGLDVGMMIEREAGDDRVGDIQIARALVDEKTGAQA